MIRTLIIDDEHTARDLLHEYCESIPELEVVGESCDGHEAISDIRRLRPELVLLDVQMPGVDGFAVLNELLPKEKPSRIIFTTAFDKYALRAFEVAAMDYLLKPFDQDRFRIAIRRAMAKQGENTLENLCTDLDEILLVRSGTSARAVKPSDVRWIEASGDYAKVHTVDGVFLAASGIGVLERQLGDSRFLRIHRSALVYLPALRQLSPRRAGGWIATLDDGTKVPVGRKFVAKLKQRFL